MQSSARRNLPMRTATESAFATRNSISSPIVKRALMPDVGEVAPPALAPRTGKPCASSPDRAGIRLGIYRISDTSWSVADMERDRTAARGPNGRLHQWTRGPSQWGFISLPPKHLAECGRASREWICRRRLSLEYCSHPVVTRLICCMSARRI
jgi:hypothetical protein